MRLILTFIVLIYSLVGFSQISFTTTTGGSFTTPSIWTRSGTDDDGDNVPDANDTIIINGGTVSIADARTVAAVTMATSSASNGISIDNTGSLTVSGAFTSTNNSGTNRTTTITALGNITVGGTLTMTSNNNSRGNSSINIGDATYSPTVQIGGDLSMSRIFSTNPYRTAVNLYYGTLDINGNILGAGTNKGSQINILDDAPYSGLTKRISFAGIATASSMQKITMNITDSDNEADFIFTYDGAADQTFLNYQDNWNYMYALIQNTGYITRILNNLDSAGTIKGNIIVTDDVTLSDSTKTIALNSNAIVMQAGSTFKICAASAVYDITSFSFDQASTVLYSNASGTLNILTSPGAYPIVELTGAGTKQLLAANEVDGVSTTVGSLHLQQGIFTVADDLSLKLSGTGHTQTLTLDAGTTWNIKGSLDYTGTNFSIDLSSTIVYNDTAQQIYSFKNSTGSIEPYGNLTFTSATDANKSIDNGDTIEVRGLVKFTNGNPNLTFTSGGYLSLLSTASYTATIAALNNNTTITYGTGQIVSQKFITLPESNYRDFTSPIKYSTLEDFEQAGLIISGLTNSDYPSPYDVSVYKYVESTTGTSDNGWTAGSNTNEQIGDTTTTGSRYSRNGWRLYSGDVTPVNYTLSDTGQINRGTIVFPLTYTYGGDDNAREEDGWHLMGNPFPSNIDWDLIVNNNSSTVIDNVADTIGIYPTMYVYSPSDHGNNVDESLNYTYYNPITLDGDPSVAFTGIVTPFQGFWLQTYSGVYTSKSFNLNIAESTKTQSSGVFYKRAKERPEVTTIIVSDSGHSDRIGFHTFPNATFGKEMAIDVNKFRGIAKKTTTSSLFIDFAQNDQALGLRVNSIPESNESFVLPIFLNSVGADVNQTIKFENIQPLLDRFECVYLHDKVADEWIDLKSTDNYNYSVNTDFTGVRFELHAVNSEKEQSTVYDASCYEKEDGLLRVKFATSQYRQYDLFRGSEKVKSFEGTFNSIKTSLGQGNYRLVNRRGIPGCDAVFEFTVGSMPLIIFEVTPSTPVITAGKEVQLNNTTSGAKEFLWTFNDDHTTSAEISPKHIFQNAGNVVVVLDAISENTECNTSKAYNYNVQAANDIQKLTSDDISAILSNGSIRITNNTSESYDINLFSINGKLIESRSGLRNPTTINNPGNAGTYILTITSSGKTRTEKFIF